MVDRHQLRETLLVDVWYPEHPPRGESNLFDQTKHSLIIVQDQPCFICGTKENREVHHYHVEWAFANAVDWDTMRTLHPAFAWETFTAPVDFVDSEFNMMVLCSKHHRQKNHGIHNLPYPVWIMQKHARKDFDMYAGETPIVIPVEPILPLTPPTP